MLPILFRSSDVGAPVLNNAAGALISVLDACLVTGFNSVGITAIAIASNVATVTTAAAHGITAGQSVTIAGIAAVAANGDHIVSTVPSSTTYTFPCVTANTTESPVGASSKRASLGWIKEFAGTNKAIYKMSDAASYGQRLRVEDATSGVDARIVGVENPTGIDTYADAFPTAAHLVGGGYWSKGANNTTAKVWAIIGDSRMFYFIVEGSAYTTFNLTNLRYTGGYFGDIISFKNGEAYGTIVGGPYLSTTSTQALPITIGLALSQAPNAQFAFLCRQHTGVTKSVRHGCNRPGGMLISSGSNAPNYPSPVDNGLMFMEPVLITEDLTGSNNPVRGILPGVVDLMCRFTDLPNVMGGGIMTATDGSGLKVIVFKGSASSQVADGAIAFKLSSSWR